MDLDTIWVVGCAGLVLLMQPGFMCLESGLTRSKNSINVAVKNLADLGISICLFWTFGFALMFGASKAGLIGTSGFFLSFGDAPKLAAFFIFQTMFCGTATTIVSGALAERLKFKGYVAIAFIISGLIYPLYGHWVWNGSNGTQLTGWLGQLGYADFAGSSVVHSVGGWVSLAALLVVGPRTGWKSSEIHGSNLPFSVLGVMLLWVGWMGFNGGSTFALTNEVPVIIAHTLMAGAAGMISAAGFSWWRQGLLRPETLINGSLAGLVSITASCNAVSTPMAVLIGAIGGWVMLAATAVMHQFDIDDGVDAVALHGVSGMWGVIALALFGELDLIGTGLSRYQQLGVQLLGAAVCFIWAFGVTYLILKSINRAFPLRVSVEEEDIGLNVSEHQAKTEVYDLFRIMDKQRLTQDLSLRVPESPYTEVGKIAHRYNQVMESLEENALQLQTMNDSLEKTVAQRTNELVQANAELQAVNAELERLDQLKDEFLANTSHELRTPLNGIIGLSEYLLEDMQEVLSEPVVNNLRMIANSGRRLFNLVNDILDFARVLHDNLSLHLNPASLDVITDVVITLCRPLASNRGVELISHVPKDLPLVLADENRLQQILYNLIGNAVKFTDEGKIEVFATVQQVEQCPPDERSLSTRSTRHSKEIVAQDIQNHIQVTVADTGIGIDSDKHKQIFRSFEQAEGYTTREYGGLGLGLAVTKRLVELQDGHIWVESELGHGARFHFTIPIYSKRAVQLPGHVSQNEAAPSDEVVLSTPVFLPFDTAARIKGDRLLLQPRKETRSSNYIPRKSTAIDSTVEGTNSQLLNAIKGVALNQTETALQSRQKNKDFSSSPFHVLIVDDDPVNLQVLNNYLGMRQYQVEKTTSGPDAIALLENGYRPDLVVLDVMMPRMSGYEVTKIIRSQWTRDELPIVLLTAKNTLEDEVIGLRAGANDYLTKPIIKEGLLARIQTQLSLRQESIERQIAQAERGQFAEELAIINADLLTAKEALAKQNQTLEQQVAERTKTIVERERQLSTLMKNLPGMAYRCLNHPRWPKTFVSEGCQALTGYTPEELIHTTQSELTRADSAILDSAVSDSKTSDGETSDGETIVGGDRAIYFETLIHPDDRKSVWEGVQRALKEKQPYQLSYRLLLPNSGEIKWVWEQGQGIWDECDELISLEGFITDVTTRVRTERKLKESNQNLQKLLQEIQATQSQLKVAKENSESANLAKSKFLASMSHELKTPLNSIIGFTQLLEQDAALQTEQRKQIQIVNRSAEHLLALINNILDLSKIEAGKATLIESRFNLQMLLTDVVDMFSLQVQRKGIALTLERASDLPQLITADEGKLRQILTNLVGNAVKFTERGSVILSVKPLKRRQNDAASDSGSNAISYLQFSIQDTGPGIASEEISQLFVPFEQTSSGRSLRQGSGLGLPISRQYARLMCGDIVVSSSVGTGSLFQLTVPAIREETKSKGRTIRQPEGESSKSVILSAEAFAHALKQMPNEWISELTEAAARLKGKAVRQLIDQIPEEQSLLAQQLRNLSESYQFEEITKALRRDSLS